MSYDLHDYKVCIKFPRAIYIFDILELLPSTFALSAFETEN